MTEQTDALATIKAFVNAWFVQRDFYKTISFLSKDYTFIGPNAAETAIGIDTFAEYLERNLAELPYSLTISYQDTQQQQLTEDVCLVMIHQNLCAAQNTWELRFVYGLTRSFKGWVIRYLHIEKPSTPQQKADPLMLETIAKQRQELLNDCIAGGMMGGYIATGFPYYFINDRMLKHLGYPNEQAFVADIAGYISNCMHPNDRAAIALSVHAQLAEGDEYTVEYRMRKRDGSYIWVHDIGRRTVAENGQPAIISVCADITKQREAQQEVLNIYNNIPGAIFRCKFNEEWTVVEANDGLYEFIGYSREEFAAMGGHMAPIIHPDDLPGIMSDFRKQIQAKHSSVAHENRLICKDGTTKWISIKGQLYTDSHDGQYLYCVFVDITSQIMIQKRMQQQYERELNYSAELSAPNLLGNTLCNISKNILERYVNAPAASVAETGFPYIDAIRNLTSTAVDDSSRYQMQQMFQREHVLTDFSRGETHYSIDYRRRLRDGSIIWCSTTACSYQNPESDDIMLFIYSFDVTQQKLAEQLLQRCADFSYDYIADIDIFHDQYRIITQNQTIFCTPQMLDGFSKEVQQFIRNLVTEDDKARCREMLDFTYMANRLEQEPFYSFQVSFFDENFGEPRIKKVQLYYIDKQLHRVCITRTDVTDIVRQEQVQKEAMAAALMAAEQANAAKSSFLSRMSHEIRTPMNAIIGMCAIAGECLNNPEQISDCISKIGASSRFLLSLINDILDMSRIESGKMLLKNERIPFEEFLSAINSICYAQASAKQVDYECIADPMLDDFYMGDSMKLQQVLINILSNAIKFTNPPGKVTFSVTLKKRMERTAVLRFIINDTGVGMHHDFLPHIFEPFTQENTGTTTVYGGTGLGLSISKSIVDMMDGKISVRSIKGVGSEFTVDVNLGIPEDARLAYVAPSPACHFERLHALVVDDDELSCKSTVRTLKEMEIHADWVYSGEATIAQVKRKPYNLILIDWKMPGMDGFETARLIRPLLAPKANILVMTAFDLHALESDATHSCVDLLLSKPLFRSSLTAALTKLAGVQETVTKEAPIVFDFKGKRVLLVEDHPLNTEIAVTLLTSKGFAVETAENGLRAMELFSKSPEGYFDAILMDIRMPVMDGLTACSHIRHLSNQDAKSIPIIAMTANAFEEDIDKSKQAGMNAHLAKPIEPQKLYQTLYYYIYRDGMN